MGELFGQQAKALIKKKKKRGKGSKRKKNHRDAQVYGAEMH